MATEAIKRRRGNSAQHAAFTGLEAELTVNTETHRLHVHDGATAGGFPHALVADVNALGATVTASIAGITAASIGALPVAGGTMAGAVNYADFEMTRAKVKDYSLTVNSLATATGTRAIDLELGNYVVATITGVTTFTFTNPPATGSAGGFVLELTNGGSSAVTWPASVKWPGGTAPTLTAAGIDVLVFLTRDGGTTWRGAQSMKDSK